MVPAGTTLIQLVLLLTWTCLITTPEKLKHPIFSKVLSDQDALTNLLSSIPMVFAPGLLEVLQASTPPTVSYFKGLPSEIMKLWAIYLLFLEKPGSRPRIYIGLATHTKGAYRRFNDYDRGEKLSLNIQRALKDGYTIVHKGCLCWTPIPATGQIPEIRTLFIALEATLTFVFWAMCSKKDYKMGGMHRWPVQSLEYDGLCSHNPLSEKVPGDHDLTVEELETQAVELEQRQKDLKHKSYVESRSQIPLPSMPGQVRPRKHAIRKIPASPKPTSANTSRRRRMPP